MRVSEDQNRDQRSPPGRVEADGILALGPVAGAVLLDPESIDRLRQLDPGGQQGVLVRILQAYETSLARNLDDIADAVAAGDAERLRRAAHMLKSSSAAVGALEFAQRCADVEILTGQAGCLPGRADVEAMVHEGRRVLVAVEAMLAR